MRLTAIAAFALLLCIGSARSAHAENPVVCGRLQPVSLADIRGLAWSGTVTSVGPGRQITFSVDHVYANDADPFFDASPDRLIAGKRFRLPNSGCNPVTGLTPDHRYIVGVLAVSSAGPASESTAAWELVGQDARFIHMYDSERNLPSSLARANTLAEVVRLVGPGAELPPTDAVIPGPASPALPFPAVALTLISTAAAGILLWCRWGPTSRSRDAEWSGREESRRR